MPTPDRGLAQFLEANEDAQIQMGVRERTSRWAGSPFEWLMTLPSRSRGKAGEVLAAAWLEKVGNQITSPVNSDHDRLVNSRKVEIKMSTLWENGNYVFQQLREQDYEFVLMLGISPNEVASWFAPKAVIFDHAVPQHGGSRGSDTRWLSFSATKPPPWLTSYGGNLDECAKVVARSTR